MRFFATEKIKRLSKEECELFAKNADSFTLEDPAGSIGGFRSKDGVVLVTEIVMKGDDSWNTAGNAKALGESPEKTVKGEQYRSQLKSAKR